MKRRTRETEARRLGNLASSNHWKQQQDEARNRFQSGTTYFQQHPDTSNPSQIAHIQRHPERTVPNHGVSPQLPGQPVFSPSLIFQPPSSREHGTLWQRIRAIQASLTEIEAIRENYQAQGVGAARQAVDANGNNEHGQPRVAQAPTTEADHPTLRSPSPEPPVSQPSVDQQLPPDEDEQQSSIGSAVDLAAPQFTYIDSTVANNTFTFGTSSSVPNIAINVTSSPTGRNKRFVASGDEDGDDFESEEPPALSTRSRKRARTGQL